MIRKALADVLPLLMGTLASPFPEEGLWIHWALGNGLWVSKVESPRQVRVGRATGSSDFPCTSASVGCGDVRKSSLSRVALV